MIYLGTVAVQNHNLKRLGFVHIGEEHLFASKARKGKLQPGDTFVLSNEAKLSAIRMKENEVRFKNT